MMLSHRFFSVDLQVMVVYMENLSATSLRGSSSSRTDMVSLYFKDHEMTS